MYMWVPPVEEEVESKCTGELHECRQGEVDVRVSGQGGRCQVQDEEAQVSREPEN